MHFNTLLRIQVKLRFVDLGFTEEVQPSSLCQLPKEFVDIPFQVSFTTLQL